MKKTVGIVFFVIVLIFIWTQSTMSQSASSAESKFVMDIIKPFLELFVGKGKVTSNMVRKIAHYAEFSLLGLFSTLFFYKENHKTIVQVLLCLLVCLVAGFLDESIQIFSNRGPGIKDVWIDLSGAFVGIAVGLLC